LATAKKLSQSVRYMPGDEVAATVKQLIDFQNSDFAK
jgi:hypothetical protein